jgi:hypothetical protein
MIQKLTYIRRIAAQILCLLTLSVPTFSYGQTAPVVVELFSSQGCASCPPVDEFLFELAQQRNIIALGWHVDYWDYIGWKDAFAHPAFTERQKAYAPALKQRMIYTPEFIINGAESLKVGRRAEIAALIQKYAHLAPGADLSVRRVGASYDVMLQNAQSTGRYDVQLVSVSPFDTVEISHGENARRRLDYANSVTGWKNLGRWDGLGQTTYETGVLGPGRYAVLVQHQNNGEIVAAEWLN